MDVAARYQPRARPDAYNSSRERNVLPDDSGAESESLTRRKFQRTTPAEADEHEFRRPAIPASATASASRVAADRRASIGVRRKSLAQREGMRVPSGPREYPGSPGKRFPSTSNSNNNAPSAPDSNRAFPPPPTPPTEPNEPLTRAQFGNPSSNEDTDSPTTPAERTNGNFDFIPTVNFDDFQSRLAGFDGPSSLLGEFPTPGGGRALPSEDAGGAGAGMVKGGAFGSGRPGTGKQQHLQSQPSEGDRQGQSGVGRSASLRQRNTSGTVPKGGTTQGNITKDTSAPAHPNVSLRSRRQSTVPQQASGTGPSLPNTTTTKHPRKSIGGNMFGGAVDRKTSAQAPPTVPLPDPPKAHLTRASSLNKPKKTLLQPATSAGAEVPRVSTLTATTASRQAKVKSLQPPPREPDLTISTPPVRSPGKTGSNRAHTPSSSGNRRQSMAASGRASGLGARTISPTDARRLKRISMMQAPPMPTGMPPKAPPTPQPQEEPPPPARVPDHYPHLMENPPSLIPRKTSNSHSLTPNSARASPEGRFGFTGGGGPNLSSKSSYQSLLNATATTNSRLPTPKTRSLHSSNANYGEEDAFIPPVPAIPKSYESPKEQDTPFFSSSRKGSATTFTSLPNSSQESSGAFAANPQPQNNRSSLEIPPHTPRKTSHRRNETIGSPKEAGSSTVKPKQQQQDATGRRNNTLQPLRLPPLNLLPLSSSFASSDPNFPKPSQELDRREEQFTAQTPEPKRTAKTPSTPMTASKATFFRRQEDKQNKSRSSTSHNVLRDMMGFDETVTRFFDDSEPEPMPSGMAIPQPKLQPQQSRSTITPFASGSVPKGSGEFARHMRGRPSGEYQDEGQNFSVGAYENVRAHPSKPQGPRPKTSGTASTYKSTPGTPGSGDSPAVEQTPQQPEQKKEGGGLRRKLSLGWRRTSSKAANHPDNKSSPHEAPTEKDKGSKGNVKSSDMPPPKLPASATWSGELPTLANTTRPSFESARRKPVGTQAVVNGHAGSGSEHEQQAPAAPKTRALHSEQPQAAANNRASSWGNFSFNSRNNANRPATNGVKAPRQPAQTSAPNALTKDKDDVAADEEMRRLSQKRRDVDSAARETEELKRRAVARTSMSPERVLHDRTCSLNIFERGEIVDYQKEGVYFTGNKNARKIIGSVTPSPTGDAKEKAGNYGYDDERGDYNIVMGDHLAYRYEVVDVLGKGSFGQVVRCVDHKDGGIVAVKIIRNKKRFHQQALVEVGILQRLRDWDPQGTHATLSITSSFYFRSHLCIVTPCLSINLYEFIRAHNFTGFSLALIRRFARQLLTCLVLLQNKHIIHCDLKPENILLCEARKADVRVIDFGSSCREEEKVYTYIQSRFYRSPEVILGSSYGLGIDMWSFGCILAELFTGYPIFPGENEQEQLACIMEIFGPPDRHLVERCTRKKLFFDSVGKPRVTVSSKGRRRRPSSKTLQQALKTDDEAFLDFITRCLRWDPDRRLKPHDAINHPFITNQPMHTRQGIPDEARRSARIRSQASGPGGGAGSPTKRSATHGSAFTHHQSQQSNGSSGTPRATRVASAAVVPATEQTPSTLRGGVGAQNSPSKLVPALGNANVNAAQRRQSSVASAQSAAGVKRASNGLLLSNGLGPGGAGGGQFGTQAQLIAQQQAQQHHATMLAHQGQSAGGQGQEKRAPSLAALAARESMAAGSASVGAGGRAGSGASGGLAAAGSGGGAGVQGYNDGSVTATPTAGGSGRWRL